jgi:hypothetical protein
MCCLGIEFEPFLLVASLVQVFRSNRNLENSARGLAHLLFVPPGQVNRLYRKKCLVQLVGWNHNISSKDFTGMHDFYPAVPRSAFLVVG